ncbi:MAG TPA: L,D-transpeptidase family protein [Actinomycetota bacterium]|jgi:lipoprotein-anchoring transpeptidase ErfK/SrfK|nr:L,D-transpeptidase family protein [Actinomycetota bacterium]
MSRSRRHAASRTRGSIRVALVVGLALLAAGGGGAYAAYRYDQATSGRVLPGIEVAGVDIGGMTRSQAIAAVEAAASSQYLDRELEVRARDETWHVTPAELGTTANVQARVDQALAAADSLSWPVRVFHRLLERPVERAYDLEYSHSNKGVRQFLQAAARSVNVDPSNAEVTFEDGKLRVRKPKVGHELPVRKSQRVLLEALDGQGSEAVKLAVRALKPDVGLQDLGYTIVIRLGEVKLYLYDGIKLMKTYPVAAGQPAYPTPQGNWHIVAKAANPTWVNPDPEGWGADLPKIIPPGPGNPLGTHAMYLDAPGIRIHGTYAASSIGTFASHGCVRMYLSDVEELFSIVPVGTPVYVYW